MKLLTIKNGIIFSVTGTAGIVGAYWLIYGLAKLASFNIFAFIAGVVLICTGIILLVRIALKSLKSREDE